MRRTMLVGLSLAVAAVVAVLVGAASGLDLESVALVGAAIGAVVALVPDRTPLARVAGFFVGFVVAWVGYAVRATVAPRLGGRQGRRRGRRGARRAPRSTVAAPRPAAALGLAARRRHVRGQLRADYAAAPPEMASTSMSTATTLLLTLGAGLPGRHRDQPRSCVVRDHAQPCPPRTRPRSSPTDDDELARRADPGARPMRTRTRTARRVRPAAASPRSCSAPCSPRRRPAAANAAPAQTPTVSTSSTPRRCRRTPTRPARSTPAGSTSSSR